MQTYSGGCQCGEVRFEATANIDEVIACNCSRCGRLGSMLAFTPASNFNLLKGEGATTLYQFNKNVINHRFCTTCGIESFASAKGPDGTEMVAINVRCVDDLDLDSLTVKKFDGKSI